MCSLYLISSFDIFTLILFPDTVFSPIEICPIYRQYTHTQIDTLAVELTDLVPDVTIYVYTYVPYSTYFFFCPFLLLMPQNRLSILA